MAAAAPNSALKRSKYFTDKSEGYKFLANAFQEFDRTDGQAGIDPYLSKKEEIHAVYNKYSIFCDYSIKSFPDRFRSLANKFKINKYKERKRTESPSK